MNCLKTLKIKLMEQCPELELREEEPMAKHTSFRIGGPVKLMALPASEKEAAAVLRFAHEAGVKPLFLGNGSNLLVADKGLEAFVVKLGEKFAGIHQEGEESLYAQAGALLSRTASFARERGLTGMEFCHGIPGSVGGAVTMNAGAYGGEMADVVEEVPCLTGKGELQVFRGEELGFGYRQSAFEDGELLVLGAKFKLNSGDMEEIRTRMEYLAACRRDKQPLEYPSAGSTFKRPLGAYAAALIDQCGLKGYRVGGAQVSEKHAGFVVNRGGATCEDVLRVMGHVRDTVLNETGFLLEPEVRILGV